MPLSPLPPSHPPSSPSPYSIQPASGGQMSAEPNRGSAAPFPSTPLVSTRFVWPHGGRSVYLCGSFHSWQKMIEMLPMEGHPSVFEVVIPLAPDFYQFKFNVDGEWRHDEQQPIITDPVGNRSNYFVVMEPENLPNSNCVERGNMDVEDGNESPQDSAVEVIKGVSVPELDVSRHFINDFLKNHTVYDLLPDSGKVVALDVSLPIKQAFHLLYEQGIPLAPLWDSNQQQFVGMLTASDFMDILMQIGSQRASLSEEELDTHTIAAWKAGKIRLQGDVLRRRQLQYVGPDDSLKEMAQKLLYHQVTAMPVLHFSAQKKMPPQLLHLATLCGVLKRLCRHFQHSLESIPLLNKPIGSLPLGTWRGEGPGRQLAVLSANSPLSVALVLLSQARVSSVPIIDENGSLLDIYSRSDITALAKDNTYAHVQLQHLTVEQALQLVHDRRSSGGLDPGLRCQMCLRTDSLQVVLERLAIPGVRRVICVEAGSRRIEGIITLSDVFKFLLV